MDDMHGLRVWDSARELTKVVITIAQRNKRSDPAGILPQLCRAANSVAANIAEAMGAATPGERLRFLRIAHRSGWETRHHVRASFDAGLVEQAQYRWLANRAAINVRMISGLIAKIERDANNMANPALRS
jgi:four helix bundle protein